MVDVLSDVLNRICEHNKKHLLREAPATRFHATRDSEITIKFYLERVAKYTRCSEECFVLALIYLDRLLRKNRNFSVSSLTVHRLMITGIMIGAKFFDDRYFNNAFFGKVGGVSRREINLMEIEFIRMINFELFVDTETYKTYNERLMKRAQSMEYEQDEPENTSVEHCGTTTTNHTQEIQAVRVCESIFAPKQDLFRFSQHQQEPSRPSLPPTFSNGVQQYPGRCCAMPPGVFQPAKLIHERTSTVRS